MEILKGILPYIQIILSVLLVLGIILQQSAAGAGGAFGSDNFSAGYHTRRGFEKFLFNGTIIIAILFAASALLALVL